MNTAPTRRLILNACFAAAVVAAAGAAVVAYRHFAAPPLETSIAFRAMGTRAACSFHTRDAAAAASAVAAVRREFDRVTKACNLHDPGSELARLNREADKGFFNCSPLLWRVLTEARRAHAASSGAFDITVKPLMDLWGFYRKRRKLPTPAEIREALARVGFDKLEWDDARHAVRFTTPGMALDLGGIAKGYALDLAAEAVLELGVKSGVIDLGGNLYLLPEPPPGKACYRIGIRSPSGDGDSGEVLELSGPCAVSTSGSYERFTVLEGKLCGHVIDPVTGEAPYLKRSATAVAPTGIESDWLSSAAFLRGAPIVPQLRRAVPRALIHCTCAAE